MISLAWHSRKKANETGTMGKRQIRSPMRDSWIRCIFGGGKNKRDQAAYGTYPIISRAQEKGHGLVIITGHLDLMAQLEIELGYSNRKGLVEGKNTDGDRKGLGFLKGGKTWRSKELNSMRGERIEGLRIGRRKNKRTVALEELSKGKGNGGGRGKKDCVHL